MIYSSRGANLNYRLVNPEPVNDLPVPSSRLQIFRRDSDNKALELERIAKDLQIRNHDLIDGVNGHSPPQKMLDESRELLFNLIQTTKDLQITHRDLINAVKGHTASQKMLEESRELLRKLISHQENVRDEEGRRIAKEVHDDLGSELTGIKSYLSTIMADNRNRGIPPDSRLEEAAKITDNASATVQRIIEGLRPSQLDHLPLWEAIDSNSRKTLKRNNIKFDSEIQRSVKEAEINSELGTALFRIIQETITNVVRHAAAKSVSLQATLKGSGMTILVKDDGRGFTIDRRSHQNSWGIIGMKERVHYFDGDFTITGDPISGGTTVTIHLPIGATHGT
jgi:signal transduction histidine kinase